MRRTFLAPIAIALLLVTAGCLGQPTSLSAPGSGDTTQQRTITVSTSGEATHAPDIAIITVTVESTAENADTARGNVADDSAAVRQALLDAGVAEDDIQTIRYAIHPEYERGEARNVTGYRAIHSYEVTVRNPDDAGTVIDAAIGAGADRVDNVRFALSDAAKQQVREEAIKNAMANAKNDAAATASAADVSVGPVHSATVSGESPWYGGGIQYAVTSDAGGRTQLDAGPVRVTVQVSVTYEIA